MWEIPVSFVPGDIVASAQATPVVRINGVWQEWHSAIVLRSPEDEGGWTKILVDNGVVTYRMDYELKLLMRRRM